ncbi:hypothetical protein [Streptomyces luteireticuli]|uniref:hypothetical protein n=1 Tax=Streptomyces luteireticuli TaxID=173858 RepID=UPI003555F344
MTVFDRVENDNLPPLARRPEPTPDPVPVTQLRPTRKALLQHPWNRLDEEAANAVTAGAVNPSVLQMLLQVQDHGEAGVVSLLMPKPVVGGTLDVIPPHQRYLDVDVLPDIVNQRWGHKVRTAMDVEPAKTPAVTYETLVDGATQQPLGAFVLRLKDRKALSVLVAESMRQTYEAEGGKNDYTESVLQQGVKEPLTLFVLRVVYDEGTEETYLVSGDGNSRLMSMWLARTGGDIEAAAKACVAAVIGPDLHKARRPADQRSARGKVSERAARVRRGLAEVTLTEATRREGHTLTFPATVVVGARAENGSPLPDLVAARDDLVANLHVHVTPWADNAQDTQAMQRVYRQANRTGLIDEDVYRVLMGAVGPEEMHDLLKVPPHRLWSAALHQHTVLAGARAQAMNQLIKQEFGMGKADRMRISEHMAPMALSDYRSLERIDPALRAFGNGGTITDTVWKKPWQLTKGHNPQDLLDVLLERALERDEAAVAELTVLGGTAAILDGYITRDRGSKESTTRDPRSAPFRATPVKLLTLLASKAGGLRMLHSIAQAHVAAHPGVLPKQFHTVEHEVDGTLVRDGDPVIDRAGAQVTIDYEWDLVYAADPVEAEAAIARNRKSSDGASSEDDDSISEDVRQRRRLERGVTGARKAATTLAKLSKARGPVVFGSPEGVQMLRDQSRAVDEILLTYGPKRSEVLDLDDDGDEDEA